MLSGMLNVEKQAAFRPGKEKARLLRPLSLPPG
jgi:hypothetical protein